MQPALSIASVKQALSTLPDLTIDGFRHTTRSGPYPRTNEDFAERRAMFMQSTYLEQIDTACEYFNRFDIEKRNGSYSLKHQIERWGYSVGRSDFVANGCAILAAIMSGYKIVRERNSPNCKFRCTATPIVPQTALRSHYAR